MIISALELGTQPHPPNPDRLEIHWLIHEIWAQGPSGQRVCGITLRQSTMSCTTRADHPAFMSFSSSVDDAITPIPAEFQLSLTEAASQYLKLRWKLEMSNRLGEPAPEPAVHAILQPRIRDELQHIAVSLAEAALHPCETSAIMLPPFSYHFDRYSIQSD